MFFIGIDIGTSSTKGAIVNKNGETLHISKREHAVEYKNRNQAEHDPDKIWWRETLNIIQELIKESNVKKEEIAGIGCSGIFPVILPVSKKGKPLRKAILYNIDKRSSSQIHDIQKKTNDTQAITYQSIIPKMKWIKDNEPIIWKNTYSILDARGYVVFNLTGKKVIDHYTAFYGGIGYSINNKDWDQKAFNLAGIDIKKMPQIKWGHEVAGYVNKKAAEVTGLLEGTPVITGVGDALAEMLSAGVYKENDTALLYGSTMPIITITNKKNNIYKSSPSWIKGQTIVSSGIRSGMDSFSWLRNLTNCKDNKELFVKMGDWRNIKAGKDGLFALPYFTSQITPKSDWQKRASFVGISRHHDFRHLFKSTVEGIGFSLRQSMEYFPNTHTVRSIGGGTRNSLLVQTISDICNIQQKTVLENIGAPLGVAWLSGYGIGLLNKNSLNSWIKEDAIFHPKVNSDYEEIYLKFKEIIDLPINLSLDRLS